MQKTPPSERALKGSGLRGSNPLALDDYLKTGEYS